MNVRAAILISLIPVFAGSVASVAAPEPEFKVLKEFDNTSAPAGLVQTVDGSLYGVTCTGGAFGDGTLYKLTLSGVWTRTIVHSFDRVAGEGYCPRARLLKAPSGNLYGTTLGGTVFELTSTEIFDVIYSGVARSADGLPPIDASLAMDADGALYGTSPSGGTEDAGVIFRLSPAVWMYSVVHNFQEDEGTRPTSGLVFSDTLDPDADDVFYGTTSTGGSANKGTVYKLEGSGSLWDYKVLHHFDGPQGAFPLGPLVRATNGSLYGSASRGGLYDDGVAFKLTPGSDPWTYEVAHHFTGADGAQPYSVLLLPDGALYGACLRGGAQGRGTIFRVSHPSTSWVFRLLHSLGAADGSEPQSLMVGTDSALYGTTRGGGPTGRGAVFKMKGSGTAWTHSIVFGFNIRDGAEPEAALIQAPDGTLYGTTAYGGSGNAGTAFKMARTGAITWKHAEIHSFNGVNGAQPSARLVRGIDGALYGTTRHTQSPEAGNGTVFRLTSAPGQWTRTVLATLSGTGTGQFPNDLLQGTDGVLYATATEGGIADRGTILKLTGSGNTWTPARISQWTDDHLRGAFPYAGLVQGADGAFYGTTLGGGTGFAGTVFRLALVSGKWVRQTIWNFTGANGGAAPTGRLLVGPDGALFGTTTAGGSADGGTVYRLALDGLVWSHLILHNFDGAAGGATPTGGLIRATNGVLYGTAAAGGSAKRGLVYSLSGSDFGTFTVCHTFAGTDGAYPHSGLVRGPDGAYYGTTQAGGAAGGGVVYRIVLGPPALFFYPPATLTKDEGDSSNDITLNVIRTGASSDDITVNYQTAGGTARAGFDYTTESGTLTFAPTQTAQSIVLTVLGDAVHESDETFFVSLLHAVGEAATITAQRVTVLLKNDDELPVLSSK